MAFYTRAFGDCADCEAVFPGPSTPAPGPGPSPGPLPPFGPPDAAIVTPQPYPDSGGAMVCPPCTIHESRWWLWLAIGFGIGYLVND
jgi:hypothetical protein